MVERQHGELRRLVEAEVLRHLPRVREDVAAGGARRPWGCRWCPRCRGRWPARREVARRGGRGVPCAELVADPRRRRERQARAKPAAGRRGRRRRRGRGAPEWRRMYAQSSGGAAGLSGTTSAPRRSSARTSTGISSAFGERMATDRRARTPSPPARRAGEALDVRQQLAAGEAPDERPAAVEGERRRAPSSRREGHASSRSGMSSAGAGSLRRRRLSIGRA